MGAHTLPPIVQRIVESGGIASAAAGYRPGTTGLYLTAILPAGTDAQLVGELQAAGSHATITPTERVLQ